MNHFLQILEAVDAYLKEAEFGNKSLATFSDYSDAEFPDVLNPKGKASPEEKLRAERAYASLKGKYGKKMAKIIRSYLTKEKKYREAIDDVRNLIDRNFVDAFVYGMRAQAGKRGVSTTFDLSETHYRWILGAAEEEGGYFEALMKDLRYKRDLRGSSMDWEQRVDLYAKTLDSVFDAGRVAGLALAENLVVFWIVDVDAESCTGCLFLEEHSPFTPDNLPCTPRDGSTECFSNCRCKILIKKVTAEEYARIEFNQMPKDSLLYQINILKQTKLGTSRVKRR